MFKKIGVVFQAVLLFYLLYAIITGVIFVYFHKPKPENQKREKDVDKRNSSDRAVLVQDRFSSLATRIQLMEQAQKTIDISYYGIHNGYSSDLFIASIFKAADRGVKVRFLYDGLINMPRIDMRKNAMLFTLHPNIEIRYYEPFHFARPWSWHNRLHDKIILIDNTYALVGGRNIGDKYFARGSRNRVSNDRDVLVINTKPEQVEESVIHQIKTYYDHVWHHPFTKKPIKRPRFWHKLIARRRKNYLHITFHKAKGKHPELFKQQDWLVRSYPVKNARFIYNPLARWNKWPAVWHTLLQLLKEANESVHIQSPYILPTKRMLKDWPQQTKATITLLTNSLAATPNLLAFSVYYTKHRKIIPRLGIHLFEFQSTKESLHTKTWIFDRKITAIGSFNMDARSCYLDTEMMLIIESEGFAEHVLQETDPYLKKSLSVNPERTYRNNAAHHSGSVLKKWFTILFSFLTRPIAFLL